MIEWLRTRSEIVDLIARLATAERHTAHGNSVRPKPSVSSWPNLMRWGFPRRLWLPSRSISSSRPPRRVERTHETAAKTRRDLDAAHRKATGAVTRKRKDLEKAEAEWTEWTSAWEAALKALQFPATATPETAEAQINAIDDMREAAGRINDLRHERIEKIERDVKAFEADVAALAQAIAPQLMAHGSRGSGLGARSPGRRGDARPGPQGCEGFRHRRLAEEDRRMPRIEPRSARNHRAACSGRPASHRSTNCGSQFSAPTRCATLAAELDRLTTALTQDGDGLSVAELERRVLGHRPRRHRGKRADGHRGSAGIAQSPDGGA